MIKVMARTLFAAGAFALVFGAQAADQRVESFLEVTAGSSTRR
jgi:hypothetical protein